MIRVQVCVSVYDCGVDVRVPFASSPSSPPPPLPPPHTPPPPPPLPPPPQEELYTKGNRKLFQTKHIYFLGDFFSSLPRAPLSFSLFLCLFLPISLSLSFSHGLSFPVRSVDFQAPVMRPLRGP